MVKTLKSEKYEQYITRRPTTFNQEDETMALSYEGVQAMVDNNMGMPICWCESRLQKGASSILESSIITKDIVLPSGPNQIAIGHKHNYDEIFFFSGMNPKDITELGGEVEFWVGEGKDLENVIFNTSSCMYVPAGLAHHPMIYRNVKKPILFMVVMLTTNFRDIKRSSQTGRPKFTSTQI